MSSQAGYGQLETIQPNWDVVDMTGDKIGNVSEVGPNYLLVTKGILSTTDIYIPTSAIASVDDDNKVYLNVEKSQIDSLGWDQPPEATWTSDAEGMPSAQTGREAEYADTGRDTQYTEGATSTDRDNLRVQRVEEDLQAQKTAAEVGEVTVRKDVIEEERTLDVPVMREEVQVRSNPVDRPLQPGEESIQAGETIRVPITEEQVQVTKQPRVVEELEIDKVATQDTQRVSDTVRKEEVRIEDQGQVRRGQSGTD